MFQPARPKSPTVWSSRQTRRESARPGAPHWNSCCPTTMPTAWLPASWPAPPASMCRATLLWQLWANGARRSRSSKKQILSSPFAAVSALAPVKSPAAAISSTRPSESTTSSAMSPIWIWRAGNISPRKSLHPTAKKWRSSVEDPRGSPRPTTSPRKATRSRFWRRCRNPEACCATAFRNTDCPAIFWTSRSTPSWNLALTFGRIPASARISRSAASKRTATRPSSWDWALGRAVASVCPARTSTACSPA